VLPVEELEKNQKEAMANLAKTDPEFFKYLQENDKDLLEFGNESAAGESSDDEPTAPVSKKTASKKGKKAASPEAEMEELSEYEAPDSDDESEPEMDLGASSSRKGKGREEPEVVTMELLKQWQKGMVQVRPLAASRCRRPPTDSLVSAFAASQKRSLKSLRRCLLAFRAAAYNNNEAPAPGGKAQTFAYEIDDPAVFSKLLLTTLHYTPTVLGTHAPFTTNAKTGRPKFAKAPPPALMKMVLSYMGNLIHLIGTLPDVEGVEGLVGTCIRESARMVPWIVGGRKVVRAYLKVRLSWLGLAFLAVPRS
jgi:nucleolar complex protein 2